MDALSMLMVEKTTSCALYHLIVGDEAEDTSLPPTPDSTRASTPSTEEGQGVQDVQDGAMEGDNIPDEETEFEEPSEIILPNATQAGLNQSQLQAVASWASPLSLIWGPPGRLAPMFLSPILTR